MFPSISSTSPSNNSTITTTNLQVHNAFYAAGATPVGTIQPAAGGVPLKLAVSGGDPNSFVAAAAAAATPGQSFYFAPLSTSVAVSLSTATTSGVVTQPIKFQTTAHAEVSQVCSVKYYHIKHLIICDSDELLTCQ